MADTPPSSPDRARITPGDLLAVGVGGALGTLLRAGGLLAGQAVEDGGWVLPTPALVTVAENLLGALALGILAGLILGRSVGTRRARLLLTTGLLGSFTTFSALAVDGVVLMGQGGALYLGVTMVGGIGLAAAGLKVGRTAKGLLP